MVAGELNYPENGLARSRVLRYINAHAVQPQLGG
jgi:hypothetical protein